MPRRLTYLRTPALASAEEAKAAYGSG